MWTLALGLAAVAVWLWPDVPARVPVHFGADGQPDRWADRSVWSWFGLPLVALATVAGLDVLTRWSLSKPGAPGFNLPNKDAILALPPARRAPVLARVASMMYGVGAVCVVVFGLVLADVWATAHGAGGMEAPVVTLAASFLGPLVPLVVGLARIQAELDRQRAAVADGR